MRAARAFIFILLATLFSGREANAGSSCAYITKNGDILTAGQWNSCFGAKQDDLGFTPLNINGGIMQGRFVTNATSAVRAGFSLPPGTAPASPVNGDLWTTSLGLYVQINGVTIGPLQAIPTVAGTSVLKGNGSGWITSAISGTDFAPATTGTAILKGSGSGGFAAAVSKTDYAPATSGSSLLLGDGSGGFSSYAGNSVTTNQFLQAISANGTVTKAQPSCGSLSNSAASCSIDATNATNIASGTLAAGRLGGMSNLSNALSVSIALNNTSNFFDGPSIAQGATGTWLVFGQVSVTTTTAGDQVWCRLWDGTNVYASGSAYISIANVSYTIPMSALAVNPPGNLRYACRDPNSTTGSMLNNIGGVVGNTSSQINAIRIN